MAHDDGVIRDAVRVLQAGGDPDAFDVIFERYFRPLVYFFANQSEFRDEAEDLAQETLYRAYQNIDQYREDAAFFTWLRRIAENVWKNAVRDSRALKRDAPEVGIPELEEEGIEVEAPLAEVAAGRTTEPEEDTLRRERARILKQAMDELPDGMRAVIELWVGELKYRQIAAALDVSLGTVKSQVFEAKERLRPVLEENFDRTDFRD